VFDAVAVERRLHTPGVILRQNRAGCTDRLCVGVEYRHQRPVAGDQVVAELGFANLYLEFLPAFRHLPQALADIGRTLFYRQGPEAGEDLQNRQAVHLDDAPLCRLDVLRLHRDG
jgi:hypothetical protein